MKCKQVAKLKYCFLQERYAFSLSSFCRWKISGWPSTRLLLCNSSFILSAPLSSVLPQYYGPSIFLFAVFWPILWYIPIYFPPIWITFAIHHFNIATLSFSFSSIAQRKINSSRRPVINFLRSIHPLVFLLYIYLLFLFYLILVNLLTLTLPQFSWCHLNFTTI